MVNASVRKLGSRESSNIQINLPEHYVNLLKNIKIEIIEVDDKHCIYFVNDKNEDILSYTIKYFKCNENVKIGFKRALEKLEDILKEIKNEN